MSFFRSEAMTLCQILLHTESAFNCLIQLGYLGKVQFRNIYDGNAQPNNHYTTQIERCNELKRIMSHLQIEIDDFNIKTIQYPDVVDKEEITDVNDLKTIEKTLVALYEELTAIEMNIGNLRKQHNHLYERIEVIKKAGKFLEGGKGNLDKTDSLVRKFMKDEMREEEGGYKTEVGMHLSFITGTIPLKRYRAFQLILWRVTRGNFLIKRSVIKFTQDDKQRLSSRMKRKYIFMIFFMGQEIKHKISLICQGFDIKLFECPATFKERLEESLKLSADLQDLDKILDLTQKQRLELLLRVSSDLFKWQIKIREILMVYFILNRMSRVRHLDMGKYLQAECWIPTKDIPLVRTTLIKAAHGTAQGNFENMFTPMLNIIEKKSLTEQDKPTYFSTNRFTKGFQNLIDAYGIAENQELNPAPYTIITFPFLFGAMFGDMGHGLIMLIFGLWMVIQEKSLEVKKRLSRKQSEIWNILFTGRYIITLMGAFSIYAGLIYNECFSKSFNIFGSSWRINYSFTVVNASRELQLNPQDPLHYQGTPYILGMDPIWDVSGENAITTFNSIKMKLAIILGVMQMIFGLSLSALNYFHKRNYVDLVLVFLPQLIFLLCIFFYLVFLIFYKWSHYGGHYEAPNNSACAPSLLIIFINMLLMKGAEKPSSGCEIWMFELQNVVQLLLLVIALICIPILLSGKPIYFMLQKRKIRKIQNEALRVTRHRNTVTNIRKSLIYNVESFVHPALTVVFQKEEEEQDLGELWIHSGIHCIESILGSVSHTASYLRLWALSLAHDQLSTVLWNMILKIGLTGKRGYWNSLVLPALFLIWAILTVALLVVMEGLSAFLHTLRLHWVEFQSKFYSGSGVIFKPFHFDISLANEIE